MAQGQYQLLRKISARTVFGKKIDVLETVLKDKTKAHALYRCIGICNGTRHGQSIEGDEGGEAVRRKPQPGDRMRDWMALLGAFQATNLITGEVFRSGVCFLPNYVADLIAGQLTGDVQNVQCAFDIYARYDEQSATSYIYEAQMLMAPKDDDPLLALAATVSRTLPSSAAKEPEPAKEPEGDKPGKKK